MFIGVDIGGTHIRVASGQKGKIEEKSDFPTKEFQASIQDIKSAIANLSENQEITRIGVGIPGPLETKSGKILKSPNLVGWDNVEILDAFSNLLKIPVVVGHDASVAALGEAYYGAGKNKNPVCYMTISTGIGVGVVVNGKTYKGVYNPEPGHQILGKSGVKCNCGQEADLETLASGSGLQKITGEKPVEVEGSKDWSDAMEWVGIGIANLILHYSPEIVIVGGGMTKHKDVFFPLVETSVKTHLHQLPPVPIVPAGLGQDTGIIGAITLAEQGS